jgi:hypothetical protein
MRTRVDTSWSLDKWIAEGISQLETWLANYAAFEDYYRERS